MADRNTLGVALTKLICPVCQKEVDGDIVMNTRLTEHNAKKVEEMHGKVVGIKDEPCDECKESAPGGVFMIECDESKTEDVNNPWRTGRVVALKEEAFKRIFDTVPPKKVCYVPIGVFEKIGIKIEPGE